MAVPLPISTWFIGLICIRCLIPLILSPPGIDRLKTPFQKDTSCVHRRRCALGHALDLFIAVVEQPLIGVTIRPQRVADLAVALAIGMIPSTLIREVLGEKSRNAPSSCWISRAEPVAVPALCIMRRVLGPRQFSTSVSHCGAILPLYSLGNRFRALTWDTP